MGSIDEIKSRLSIEEVIGDYVELRRAGVSFKARCPFHEEKTPSFTVSQEKQMWYCFGCSQGGDMFTFVERHEGVDFKEAAEILARKAGVTLEFRGRGAAQPKQSLFAMHEDARLWFQENLQAKNEAAGKVREYLASRGITDESIATWSLGLAPDTWDGLLNHLKSKQYTQEDIIAGGLAVARDGKIYDRFRRRLMFPIADISGRTIAFTARSLAGIMHADQEVGGKYVNSPTTPIYNKSQALYGLHLAKQQIKQRDYVIVVEGNMDAIASYQAGMKNCVAVSGTALTPEQLSFIKRFTTNIMLAFDADTAGSQAAFRGIAAAWKLDANVKVIVLKGGKDPAEIIQQNPDAWKEAVRTSVGVVDFYFEEIFSRVDLARADHKKIAAQKIMSIIGQLKTKIEQTHYVQRLSKTIAIPERVLWDMLAQQDAARGQERAGTEHAEARKTATAGPRGDAMEKPKGPRTLTPVEHMISFVAQYPMYAPILIDTIEPDQMEDGVAPLYKKIIVHYTQNHELNLRTFARELDPAELQLWSELAIQGEIIYARLNPHERETEFHALAARIQRAYITQKLKALTEHIAQAEAEGRTADVARLMDEYQSYRERRVGLQDQ